jgi:protocatechuate 3,4-dioxygenase beta subunit
MQDYYSFTLTKGQSATIAVESLNSGNVQITLVNGSGTVLATGVGGSTNVSESIENFVASASGKYYVEVTGDTGAQYSLTVTRGAAFSIQPHNSMSMAENVTGTGGVLGYLPKPIAPVYLLDDQLYNAFNPIYVVDPTTGAFIGPAIAAPDNPENNPFGLNMAYDGTYLYYNDGAYDGSGDIYKIDASTGTVVSQISPANGADYSGLAYLDGNLYATNILTGQIDIYSAATLAYESTINSVGGLTGLAGDPDRDVLWAVTQGSPGTIFEINPTTGAVITSAPDHNDGLNEQDIAYNGNVLIVSETNGLGDEGGTNVLAEYNPNTLAFLQNVPVNTEGFASGLGSDGVGGTAPADWYSVNVQAGQSLYLQSSTPSDAGRQFVNTASLEISLYNTYGDLVAVGTKLADGRNESLLFTAPVTGQYHIEITEDPGGVGEYYLSVNTPSYPSGGVSAEVFNDLNGNGKLDSGEPGLTGWEVDVYNSSKQLIASQLTDANGDFDFQGLVPGTYTVSEVLQGGWIQTAPPSPGTFTVTVAAGSTVTGENFANFQLIGISGEVYNDLNGNGTLDPGDPSLKGWTVDLVLGGKVVETTTTDSNGDYSFSDLGPGTYTVQEVVPTGWLQTAPPAPGTYRVSATSGTNATGLIFGNFQYVTYSGTVYNDLNGNGTLDPGEPGLKGWTVDLLQNGNVIAMATSSSSGNYSFGHLLAGVYTIEEITPSGWYLTQPANPFSYTLTATSGSRQTGLNFGNFQLVSFSGDIYNDLNGNGIRNPGEPGLQGWTVDLENSNGNIVATTTTDANGNYSFTGLYPGTFEVAQVVQSGWVQTQPQSPTFYTITTQSGLNISAIVFGDHQSAPLDDALAIDNGQTGYAESGSWSTTAGAFDGANRVAKTMGGGGGTSAATWTFSGLSSGKYEVFITFAGKGTYSSAAPFTVSNGSTSLGTIKVNESVLVTATPGQGLTQGSYGGVGWVELGTYSISTGTLKVSLSNAATGNFVDADGALIIPVAAPAVLLAKGLAPAGGNPEVLIGTVPPVTTVGLTSTKSTSAGKTGASPIALAGVTQPIAISVIYDKNLPAPQQSTSVVDLILGQNGTSSKETSDALVTSLASDVVSSKKTTAS